MPTDLGQNLFRIGEARLASHETPIESAQPFMGRGDRFVIPVQPKNLSIRTTPDQNRFGVASAAQRAVEISLPWFGTEPLDQLRNQHRNMLEHGSVTGSVTLPIVIEALDRVLEGRIVLEEAVHADDFENIAQERTHSRKL